MSDQGDTFYHRFILVFFFFVFQTKTFCLRCCSPRKWYCLSRCFEYEDVVYVCLVVATLIFEKREECYDKNDDDDDVVMMSSSVYFLGVDVEVELMTLSIVEKVLFVVFDVF